MQTPGVLVELLNVSDDLADEDWCAWYDQTVLTARAELPGVIAARRATGVVGSVAHMMVYDLADFGVPLSQQWAQTDRAVLAGQPPSARTRAVLSQVDSTLYRQILSTTGAYEPPPAEVIHGAFFEVDPPNFSEFNDWYDTEHVRFVDVIAGYHNCRRFVAFNDPSVFLALYDVDALDVAQSKETAQANESPWSDRVRAKLVTKRERRLFRTERLARGSDSGRNVVVAG